MKKNVQLTKGELYFNDELSILVNRVSERFELREHAHEFVEICYVWEGSGFHYIGDKALRVTKGDLFFIPIGISHVFRPSSSAADSHLIVGNCIFEQSVLDSLTSTMPNTLNSYRFKHIGSHVMKDWIPFREHRQEFGSLFDRMLQESQQARLGFHTMLLAMLLELLLLLERRLENESFPSNAIAPNERMDIIIHYIRSRLHEPLSLRDVSRQIQLGERQVQRIIQASTGLTFTSLLRKERIEKSCILLEQTTKTAAEIAPLVGFHDMKHFHRLFKQLIGMTPIQFRQASHPAATPRGYSS
ncbi:AraC family transcriptional regulator [Paenibacillus sp. PL91]|uniref:AraC family transcriptional regulator n=1 Tax=Paenibacillus sp. PL91 TaxID=2729538 RepID=UPI00145DE2E3|nr:AraC family transcriptional regulator [Paenibacillus sp. PL91]MBC9202163.1 helix-turn-helix transcriptional regulator [Paenibacillus sp. PL91]